MQTFAYDPGHLPAHANAFETDGVVRITGLLLADELALVRRHLDEYVQHVLPGVPASDYTFEADGKSIRNLWRLHEHDGFFAELADRPQWKDQIAPLVHGEPVVVGVETFNKPARVGSVVPFHQDNAYFCLEPPDVLTLWIALDPVTEANGAVRYLEGSHDTLLPHVPSGVKGNSYGLPPDFQPNGYVEAVGLLSPGDALIHHGQTIHRSDPNRSDRSRLSLVIVYRGAHACRDPERWRAYQQALSLTPQNA